MNLPDKIEPKVGDYVYSEFFKSKLKIVAINSDDDWYFELNGRIMKAKTPLSYFYSRDVNEKPKSVYISNEDVNEKRAEMKDEIDELNHIGDGRILATKDELLALKKKWELKAVREDRLYNARFYKHKIDKLFDSEIQVYTEALSERKEE